MGIIGKTEAAYFKKINDAGGITAARSTSSLRRRLQPAEGRGAGAQIGRERRSLFVFNSLGTPSNSAIQKYMNAKKVPQLFVRHRRHQVNDQKDFPWTMGWPAELPERVAHLREVPPEGESRTQDCVLYQNDDYGKDYLKGLKDGLWRQGRLDDRRGESYETTEHHRQSHRQTEIDRAPMSFMDIHDAEIRGASDQEPPRSTGRRCTFSTMSAPPSAACFKPLVRERASIISAAYLKDVSDPQWDNDPA